MRIVDDELIRYTIIYMFVHNVSKTGTFRMASVHLVNVVNEFLKPLNLHIASVGMDTVENLRHGILSELVILGATFYTFAYFWRTAEYRRREEQQKLYGGMKSSEPRVNYN